MCTVVQELVGREYQQPAGSSNIDYQVARVRDGNVTGDWIGGP